MTIGTVRSSHSQLSQPTQVPSLSVSDSVQDSSDDVVEELWLIFEELGIICDQIRSKEMKESFEDSLARFEDVIKFMEEEEPQSAFMAPPSGYVPVVHSDSDPSDGQFDQEPLSPPPTLLPPRS